MKAVAAGAVKLSGGTGPLDTLGTRRREGNDVTPVEARRAISLVDLTNLADDCDEAAVEALCDRAARFGTAAVCVWPDFVASAARRLADVDVGVATVVNFPTGDERIYSVVGQTNRALDDGATEIDLVLPYKALLAGDRDHAIEMIGSVRAATSGRALLKVILETGELTDLQLVTTAAEIAVGAGADFIKTSTGKSRVSATPEAATAMLHVIAAAGRPVGLKPSGGISTADDAARYIALADDVMGAGWVTPATFRFGASSLLAALLESAGIDGEAVPPTTGY